MSGTPGDATAAKFARAEAWRSHPLLKPTLRHALPGFTLGLGAFAVYYVGSKAMELAGGKKEAHGHGHGAAKHH